VRIADELGVEADVINYLKHPIDATTLRAILDKLEDPPTDLVRRDAQFGKLGLSDGDVETADQIVEVLVEHPRLLQRPLLVTDDTAIIGRPKERVAALLG
jgi:arsenate reductase